MKSRVTKHVAVCPGCDSDIQFSSEPRIGTEVDCRSCGAALEVIFLRPIELDWTGAEYEDDDEWEDVDRWDSDY